MSPLKIIGALAAGILFVVILNATIAMLLFAGADSPAQAQPTAIQPAPAPTGPPLKVGLDVDIHSLRTEPDGFGKVVYTVSNTGDVPVDQLQVKIILLDSADNPLKANIAYPNGREILWPGGEAVHEVQFMDYDMIGVESVRIKIQKYREV